PAQADMAGRRGFCRRRGHGNPSQQRISLWERPSSGGEISPLRTDFPRCMREIGENVLEIHTHRCYDGLAGFPADVKKQR
ncbi:MAG: hypothetical protein FWF60_06975, partial [Oscillospiraceae bacterium]|nr:hypothetical protein [Oscillospiraceae bacterium]